jgi:hypothetical protein
MKTIRPLFGILTIAAALAVQVQAQSFLTSGLVAYYPFNGNAIDATGHGKDGIVVGATLAADRFGIPNSAYSFDGVSSRIILPDTLFSPADAAWTVSIWIATNGLPHVPRETVFEHGCRNGEMSIGFGTNESISTSGIWFAVNLGEPYGFIWTNALIYPITPMQVVGVYEKGQSISLYVNGALAASTPVPNRNLFVSDFPLGTALGTYDFIPRPYDMFCGTLDDFRVYNRALSSKEVAELYASESVPRVTPSTAVVMQAESSSSAKENIRSSTSESVSEITPSTAVFIPADFSGPVNIILESSTDLRNWSVSPPGTYRTATTNRFFRVRAERVP